MSEIEQLRDTAKIGQQILQKFEEDKILFYKPCCRVHENNCPSLPCPDSKHTKFHLSPKRIRVAFGGNRSGKSTLGLTELLMMACFKNHPYRKTANRLPGKYRIYSTSFSLIQKHAIPLVKEWIPKSCLKSDGKNKEEAWEKSFDNKFSILYLKNGSTIDFLSYEQDLSKSESVELDGIWADEEMPEDIYSAALSRLISREGYFWMTVTPLYAMSWGMKFLDTPDPQVEVFNFDIYDNSHLPKQAIIDFENSVPEHLKEAKLHGRFMELQGIVYKELKPEIHLIDHDEPKSGYPVIFSLDPHPRKPSVMTWAYVTQKDDIVFFDELEMRGSARDIVSAIKQKESRYKNKVMLRLIDPAAKAQGSDIVSYGTDTLQEFEKEGMKFTLADNSEAGYNVVHEYLTFDPSRPIGPLNRPTCFFTKNVTKTWYAMTHLLWDEWNFRKSLKEEKERVRDYKKDFPDCVRYILTARPRFNSFFMRSEVPMKISVGGGLLPRSPMIQDTLKDMRRNNEFGRRALQAA